MLNQNKLSNMTAQLSPIKKMFNTIKMASNPQMALTQMMKNNPAFAQAQKLIEENGGDAKTAFYKLAEKQGVDPNQILNMFR